MHTPIPRPIPIGSFARYQSPIPMTRTRASKSETQGHHPRTTTTLRPTTLRIDSSSTRGRLVTTRPRTGEGRLVQKRPASPRCAAASDGDERRGVCRRSPPRTPSDEEFLRTQMGAWGAQDQAGEGGDEGSADEGPAEREQPQSGKTSRSGSGSERAYKRYKHTIEGRVQGVITVYGEGHNPAIG